MRITACGARSCRLESSRNGARRRWWSQAGSNRRPPACKAGALPAELWPRSTGDEAAVERATFARPLRLVGLGGFEPPTSPLSGVRSNQLSYRPVVASSAPGGPEPLSRRRPALAGRLESAHEKRPGDNRRNRVRDTAIDQAIRVDAASRCPACFKEVIQPQVPLRLPCYDFTPVMDHTVVTVLPVSEDQGLD